MPRHDIEVSVTALEQRLYAKIQAKRAAPEPVKLWKKRLAWLTVAILACSPMSVPQPPARRRPPPTPVSRLRRRLLCPHRFLFSPPRLFIGIVRRSRASAANKINNSLAETCRLHLTKRLIARDTRIRCARFFVLSFGLQYPLATTKAWLHATLLHWCFVNFLFAPLKIGFFAVALPKLICGKLRRLRYPKRALGSFPFHTPMRDSAVDYVAARHAHLPIAKFLLRRQGHDACATGEQPTPPHRAKLADVVAASGSTAGPSPTASAVSPLIAPSLDELLHLGDAHRHGDEGSALLDHGRTRARSHGPSRRACGTSLALVTLSLVLFMPALLQELIVDEFILVLVSLIIVAAVEVASIGRLIAAACSELVHAHGPAAVAAVLVIAAVVAGLSMFARRAVRASRAHRRTDEALLGGAFDAEMHSHAARVWCWPAPGRGADDEVSLSPVVPQGTPSRNRDMRSSRVAPA